LLVDFDDFSLEHNRFDLLLRLKDANPKFRCTLFAIPGKGTDAFWDEVPEWCELAVHGWLHPHSRECESWSYDRAVQMIETKPARFVRGFKAPGWQISDETYLALRDHGWWVADHWENEGRRPESLVCHVIKPDYRTNGDHWHGHIPNVEGNGIEETFPELLERVKAADSFKFISEVVA
jgi:hypothetical protein